MNKFQISRFTRLGTGPKIQYLFFRFKGESFHTDYEIHFNDSRDEFKLVYEIGYYDALAPDIFLNRFLKSIISCEGITAV